MNKPSRPELLAKFFPELTEQKTSSGREASAALALRSSEMILIDMINQFDKLFTTHGSAPGILMVSIANNKNRHVARWYSYEDCSEDIGLARDSKDTATESFLTSIRDSIIRFDTTDYALIALSDNTTHSVLPIPRDHPAKGIEKLIEACNAS